MYYCNSNTQETNMFTSVPAQDVLWNYPYLSVYSADGKKCYVNRMYYEGTCSFTAERTLTYICIEEAGYNSGGEKAYLLIRKVE